jgi:hypothetical protein
MKSFDMVSFVDTHPDICKEFTANPFQCALDFINQEMLTVTLQTWI